MAQDLTTGSLLAQGTSTLAGASQVPHLDAELLLAHCLKAHRARLKSHPEERREVHEAQRYLDLVARRAAGEPLAYIVGYRDFWTLRLQVDAAVLVPRPETELLVERALAVRAEPTARVADLGTGSGAIALAPASERPR